jgi:hypothetical protein
MLKYLVDQVFSNIINAIKYNDKEKAKLNFYIRADFHEFTIRDNGQVFQKISGRVLAFQTIEARDIIESTGIDYQS